MSSTFFSKFKLRHWYLDKQQSSYRIAEICGCDPKTVYYWLKKYNIPTRPKKTASVSKTELNKLYNAGLSLKTIGLRLGITPSAIYRKMVLFHLPRRSPWDTNTIHPRNNFSDNALEKAYLIGFRIGDLNVVKKSNASSVKVKSNTTHVVQVRLMKSLFSQYGPVWVSSPESRKKVYHFTAHLNSSFNFLVPKPTIIPRWIFRSQIYFWVFLAGYIDAEGTIKIYAQRARLRIGSYDTIILGQIHQKLSSLQIKNSFRLETKTGYNKQNGNFYRVDIMDRFALNQCLLKLLPYLKHQKRRLDAHTALQNVVARM